MINSIIARFDSLHLEYGEFAISHIGQHSFILKVGGTVIYIDPYLTPERTRLIAPLLKPEEITNAAIITGSHNHGDHIDLLAWPKIAASSPDACFVLPEAVRKSVVRDTGIAGKRVFGLNDGGSIDLKRGENQRCRRRS